MNKRFIKTFLGVISVLLISQAVAYGEETIEADVVVIGAGGAGLSASLVAAKEGAKVVILEKMSVVGGNTNRSGGGYNAAATEFQKRQGIEDSKDLFFDQSMKGGRYKNDPELLRTLVDNATPVLEDMIKSGLIKVDEKVIMGPGALYPRSLMIKGGGAALVIALKSAVEKEGVKIFLDTRAVEILRESHLEGRVTGVKALDKQGNEMIFKAKKAIIIATGGFGANKQMLAKYDYRLKDLPTLNHPGATGEGILMAQDIGADTVGMDYIQILPFASKEGTLESLICADFRRVVLVSRKGLRFVAEDRERDVINEALVNQPGSTAFLIVDENAPKVNLVPERPLKRQIEEGVVEKASSFQEMAEKMEVPADAFVKTMENYNRYVEAGKDLEFGRAFHALKFKIETPPFYASPVYPATHHTMGGLRINPKTQVLDRRGRVIPGLYAAGEVTGGVHGANRVGGNAVAEINVFGRIAGKEATKEGK